MINYDKGQDKLLVDEKLRDELIEQVEVLDKVKDLLLLPNTDMRYG